MIAPRAWICSFSLSGRSEYRSLQNSMSRYWSGATSTVRPLPRPGGGVEADVGADGEPLDRLQQVDDDHRDPGLVGLGDGRLDHLYLNRGDGDGIDAALDVVFADRHLVGEGDGGGPG